MIIDITTFRLAPGTDEATFLEVDTRVQAELHLQPEALVRRTTARRDDGTWLVLTLWWQAPTDPPGPAGRELLALLDESSLREERFETLD